MVLLMQIMTFEAPIQGLIMHFVPSNEIIDDTVEASFIILNLP